MTAALAAVSLVLPLSMPAAEPEPLTESNPVASQQLYVADIELQNARELTALLQRAEQLLLAGFQLPPDEPQVVLVLHGPVLRSLLRENYHEHKPLVDLAASLSAMQVIEVKACRAWMRSNRVAEDRLQPFVEVVPYGPGLVRELVDRGNYIYF